MPIYEYRCLQCNEHFQKLQFMSAGADGVRCPSCDSPQVERQLSAFASTTSASSAGAAPGCGPSGGG